MPDEQGFAGPLLSNAAQVHELAAECHDCWVFLEAISFDKECGVLDIPMGRRKLGDETLVSTGWFRSRFVAPLRAFLLRFHGVREYAVLKDQGLGIYSVGDIVLERDESVVLRTNESTVILVRGVGTSARIERTEDVIEGYEVVLERWRFLGIEKERLRKG